MPFDRMLPEIAGWDEIVSNLSSYEKASALREVKVYGMVSIPFSYIAECNVSGAEIERLGNYTVYILELTVAFPSPRLFVLLTDLPDLSVPERFRPNRPHGHSHDVKQL